jgi:tape measure domain-containing protein
MKAASTTAAVMRRALTGLGAGLVGREFIRLSDSFTNVQNRLKLVTDGTAELTAVQEELFRVSQETRTSFEANATLFNRLALSSKDLGISLDDVVQITQSLNQAVILSGAATTEASAGLIQLSQGLASNRLSGDELRSVLEQLPVVADVIAKQLGVTRGELKFFGEAGKISADIVIEAFKNAREELAVRFGETVPTVAQSFVILRNAAIRFVGNLNNSTGVVTNLSRLIIGLAGNFDTLAKSIGVVAAALGPLVLGRAIGVATVALRGLFLLMLRNPIGLLVAGLAAATTAIINFGNQPIEETLESAEGGFSAAAAEAFGLGTAIEEGLIPAQTTWADVMRGTLQAAIGWIKETASFYIESWRQGFNKVLGFFGVTNKSWADIFSIVKNVLNKTIGLFVGFAQAWVVVFQKAFNLVSPILTGVFDTAKKVIVGVIDFAKRALEFIAGIVNTIFNTVRQNAENTADYLGIDLGEVAGPIVNDAVALGDAVSEAFLEGYNRDYLGELGKLLLPAYDRVIQEAGVIAEKRLGDAAKRLEDQAGVDLTKKGDPAVIIRPEDARAIEKLVEKTRTPLETYLATIKEIERLQPFAKGAEQVEALGRAIEQAGLDRISAEFDLLGLDDISTVMAEAVPAVERYNMAMVRLNELLEEGVINQTQFDAAVINAKDKILGLKDIYAEFTKEAARSIQSAFADFLFDPFEEGLDGMIRGMAETLRKIAADILATQILKSFLSLVPGGGVISAALADGGPAQAGKSYLVGEQGPEIFTPRSSGTVTPNGEMPAVASPQVNVAGPTIVNTIDDGQIVQAFNRGGGGQVVLNDMTERKAAYRQALGIN